MATVTSAIARELRTACDNASIKDSQMARYMGNKIVCASEQPGVWLR